MIDSGRSIMARYDNDAITSQLYLVMAMKQESQIEICILSRPIEFQRTLLICDCKLEDLSNDAMPTILRNADVQMKSD